MCLVLLRQVVKPKLEALAVAQAQMDAANKALRAAEQRLDACKARLKELQVGMRTRQERAVGMGCVTVWTGGCSWSCVDV